MGSPPGCILEDCIQKIKMEITLRLCYDLILIKKEKTTMLRYRFYYLLFILAFVGLVLSGASHISTYFGFDPGVLFPVFVLHLGIFAVIIPCIRIQNKVKEAAGKKAAGWKGVLVGIGIFYIIFNFFFTIFVLLEGGQPFIEDGQKVLKNHGAIIRLLTDDEYRWYNAYMVRSFSGHWMLFYGVAAAMLKGYLRFLRQKPEEPGAL
jgi:hypothetical protein